MELPEGDIIMQSLSISQFFTWLAFFMTTVYGHVAMKLAVDGPTQFRKLLVNPWAVSAMFAWIVSGLLWMSILSKQSLLQSNSVASLRYALIALSAVFFLGESLNPIQILGSILILIGVYLTLYL